MAPNLLGLLAALVGAGAFLPPVSVPRLRFLRRLGIRRAGAVEQRKNLTLLTCLAAPRVRYLGDNATLFLRYLNATSPSPIPADAEVASEQLDAASAGARVEALWRSRELIVHDKAAYREAVAGSKLAGQLAGGARRASAIWAKMPRDVAAARRYVDAAAPGLPRDGAADAAALKALLVDFKERYPYYHGQCTHCGAPATDFVGEISASEAEAEAARAGRVELRFCEACHGASRFVRANDVGYALHTSKRGRCGEYSAAFLAVLVSLGMEARWVFDTTDHVWCECKLGGTWVHVDPCEASIGEPQIYEGWGKNGTLVVAFGEREAVDVTDLYYANQKRDVKARRKSDGLTAAAVRDVLAGYAARDGELGEDGGA